MATTMKLIQKKFLKGTREFEIAGDVINVRLKSPLKEEKLTVMLSILNPEPVVNEPFLEFHSRVQCGPLLSLFMDTPSAEEFETFVTELKRRALQEYNAFAGLKNVNSNVPAANTYEDPPDFDEPGKIQSGRNSRSVNAESIDTSIRMLETHLDKDEIKPLLNALEALKAEPENESSYGDLVHAFENLGTRQGAVLTYAPYISVLLADDHFGH